MDIISFLVAQDVILPMKELINMNKLENIVLEIYRLQYKYAEPSADLDALMASGETKKTDWFMKYYMPQEWQQTIMDFVCQKHKLTSQEKRSVSIEVNLGCSPNTSLKTWKEARKKCQVRNLSAKKKSKK
jgi:hypothetical protein